jgi:ubiquinone/menaquinone biosynthesis C-methylase UbiE
VENKINFNPFAQPEVATGYEDWYQTEGRGADQKEKELLAWLLTGLPDISTILEVGCGSGHFTRWFMERDLQAVGLDLSRPMLDEAIKLGGPIYIQGDALMLPFAPHSFDLVVLITTLEFLPNPRQALAEAARVARQALVLGVLNAQSRLRRQYERESGPVWEAARFFTPTELRWIIREVIGDAKDIVWRTTLWSFWSGALPLPWGGFIGMAVNFRDIHQEEK